MRLTLLRRALLSTPPGIPTVIHQGILDTTPDVTGRLHHCVLRACATMGQF